jgi:ketosteroid isomerase-like protein
MSDDNVALVLRTFDAFREGGFDAMHEFFSDDVVWHPIAGWIEDAEYRGHEGTRMMSRMFTDNFADLRLEPRDVRELHGHVLALVDAIGKTRHDGVPIEWKAAMLYSDIRAQKIGEVRFFMTWEEGLRALDATKSIGSARTE